MYTLGAHKSKFDPRDWKFKKVFTNFVGAQPLPLTLDLRDKLPQIRDQGNIGSCVAFASSAMKDFQEKTITSPLFIYSQRVNKPAEGMFVRNALEILKSEGTVEEKIFPYKTELENIPPSKEIISEAKKYEIKSYAKINSVDEMKNALVHYGPVLIAIDVYNFGSNPWIKYQKNDRLLGGHALAIVGYTQDSFIIRNSWGTNWGEKGYTYLNFNDFNYIKEAWSTIDLNTAEAYKDNKSIIQFIIDFFWTIIVRLLSMR